MQHEEQWRNSGKRANENLRPWAKGTRGNPNGRPRHNALTEALRERLAADLPGNRSGRTVAEAIAAALLKRALRGDVRAIRKLGTALKADHDSSSTLTPMRDCPAAAANTTSPGLLTSN